MRTNKFISFIWRLAPAALLMGCASADLKVSTTPDQADVYLAYEGEQPVKVGATPLRLEERINGSNRGRYVTLSIKKDGYKTESVLIPLNPLKSKIDVSLRLEEAKLPEQCQNQTAAVEKISKGIADSQSLVKSGNLSAAQARLSALINEYPNVTVLHDLLGNVYYLGKNLEAALASYQRSLNLDATNADTQRMVNKIREILGQRLPSSKGGN